jgi:hypothetical protein
LAELDATKISNVNQNMMAQGPASESGVKDRQRINQGLIGSEVIFDNMRMTRAIYSETMVDLIRYGNTFSTAEMVAIASDAQIEANVDQLLAAIKSRAVGEYGIKVEESPSNPTIRFANFEMLLEMAKLYGPIIPPDMVIEASDVHNKDQIIQRVQQTMQAQAQAAQQQQQAEQQGQQQQKKQLQKR